MSRQGYYFLHASEMCLVGVKTSSTKSLEYISKVGADVLFAKALNKSEKPEELYELIEAMCPGSRKIELFARNNNIRRGWLSVGIIHTILTDLR
jgi:N6-adenosine-specific RNA methylase IME4